MRKGARGIILKDGKILLGKRLKRDSFYGSWCTFGGYVEPGETSMQALKRELNEELGIDVIDPKFLTATEIVLKNDSRDTLEIHFFLVREWKGEIANRSEHSEIRWFSRNDLKGSPIGWIGKEVIEKYLNKTF